MSNIGDIAGPPGRTVRFRIGVLLAPLGLLAVWAIAAPFLHAASVREPPARGGLAAGR